MYPFACLQTFVIEYLMRTQNVFHHVWIPIWCGMCLASSPSSIDFTWFMKLFNYMRYGCGYEMDTEIHRYICIAEYACVFFQCSPSWVLRISNKKLRGIHTRTHTYAHQVTDRTENEFSWWFIAEKAECAVCSRENMTHLWANAT